MRTSMSLEEFAELVKLQPAEIRELVVAGLLDPAREGRFDDLDLVRLMSIRHHEALGYDAAAFAKALKSGEVKPFLGEYTYPRDDPVPLEEAAERVGLDRDL